MIYLDLVIALNFAVDFLLLLAANRLSGFPLRLPRFLAAAALGGLYGGICLLPAFRFLGSGFWRITALAGMAIIAFGIDRSALRRGTLFVLLSMALGGVALGFGRGGGWQILAAALSLLGLCYFGFSGRAASQQYVSVELIHHGAQASLIALLDTGNTLRDPISGEPVLIAGPDAAKKLLGLTEVQLASPVESGGTIRGLRLIPYRAVGCPMGMLLAFRPEQVTIGGKPSRTIVAFSPHTVGNEGYQALAGGLL